jgi:uncharacterized BrkB/YihY/UPF0761 family membrane protein
MKSKNQTIAVKYGLITGIVLILYLLLLYLFGLHTKPIFSIMNGAITGAGIYGALDEYQRKKNPVFKYHKGFMVGLLTGFFATVIFTIFFAVFASNIDSQLLETWWEEKYSQSLGLLIFVVAVMGFATTVVLTLTLMQLFKDSWNTHDGRKHTITGESDADKKKYRR